MLTKLGDYVDVGPNAGGWYPALNADGTRVAFESNLDLTGQNPDFSREIFLVDTVANALSQISSSPVEDQGPGDTGSVRPSIDADGVRVAFLSNRDEMGQNLDHNAEIFLCDTKGAISGDATRDAAEIESFLADRLAFLDVDDNQRADALTDGLLVLRYLSAFRGADLIDGAIAPDASRTTAAEIELALGELQ